MLHLHSQDEGCDAPLFPVVLLLTRLPPPVAPSGTPRLVAGGEATFAFAFPARRNRIDLVRTTCRVSATWWRRDRKRSDRKPSEAHGGRAYPTSWWGRREAVSKGRVL